MITAVAATSEIHVIRDTPMTQSLDLVSGGTFSAENVEEALDKNCRMLIDNADGVSRALRAPSTDSSALDMTLPSAIDRASKYLAFTATGAPTTSATVAPATATLTAYGESLVAVADEAALKTLINAEVGVDVQAWSTHLDAIAALAHTDSNIIVGNTTTWVAESGATLRTSIGTLAETEACRVDASHAYTGTGIGFRDEDDMLSNDATAPASQQSIRAFLYSIVTYDGDVLTHDGEVLTYV
jgi:hypothetical protein